MIILFFNERKREKAFKICAQFASTDLCLTTAWTGRLSMPEAAEHTSECQQHHDVQ
jgi:hypothetical protein